MDANIEAILRQQTDEVRGLLEQVMPILREFAPALEEYGQEKLGNIVYKGRRVVMTISPYKQYVNLNFYYGTHLHAADGILKGSGGKLRHVRIARAADIDREVLASLVGQSLILDGKG